jgi:uncharacterized damage-inducible protein DinB
MDHDSFVMLFAYNSWANAKVLNTCRMLTTEELHAPAQCSFSSLMGTLVHIYTAERVWRLRMQDGIFPSRLETGADFLTLQELEDVWVAEDTAMRNFIDGLEQNDLERQVEYKRTSGQQLGMTLWKILTHVSMHSMQFRAEAGVVLAGLGHSPGDMDLILYLMKTKQL